MSLNWVMLAEPDGFALLPGEQRLWKSSPRTTLSLQSKNKFPGNEPFSLSSSAGTVYLTNQRVVYLPAKPTEHLQSFAAFILNLRDTHVVTPLWGANYWLALVRPVPGGNIPPQHSELELKLTFKDGGAYDFATTFGRIKERLQQAVDVARDSGRYTESDSLRGPGAFGGVDLEAVHLDQLPAYEPPPPVDAPSAPSVPHPAPSAASNLGAGRDSGLGTSSPDSVAAAAPKPADNYEPPADPPPDYEEVQRESVADELERRLRNDESGR
ncbi:hypothetical protein IWX90DRAFT_428779 [Phyllosticta citrichinensis]|uniref:WW domain-binding protein n=1 Tax=Phyllosticta citrichinensis TaxID=1130410 RepID=A0ABR1Y0G5_9PEZI